MTPEIDKELNSYHPDGQTGEITNLMQDKIEPLTADELSLLQYLFYRHRNDCYAEMGATVERGTKYERTKNDLALLSEIERKLEASDVLSN